MSEKFSIKKRIKSFSYAFDGLKVLLKEEHNARIHAVITLIIIILGLLFDISATEWMFICLAIGLVIVSETLNTAIENLSDLVSPTKNDFIKKAKDLGAFAVLFSALIAVIIGLFIFLPHIINLFIKV
ncbi:diacylglycerol kinase [Dysgonomonas sp. 216]|uniref:diacylglycerol kinase n=1 Tax=Dysgonomonas sp. 216 TaxID=2302934 RepID=UPI002106946D|nr:diacylglycerol kinase family protein [Dysgonomonas sp. 216]